MRPYAEVIGDPIAHSKSPLIHNFWLDKLDIHAEYRAVHVPAAALGDYFAARSLDPDWRGCNITMPHKIAARTYVRPDENKGRPMNTVVPRDGGFIGLNTDVIGVLEPLTRLLISNDGKPKGARPAAVVGAGGALYPVLTALRELDFSPVTVIARDPGRLAQVERDYGAPTLRTALMDEPLPPIALLVNASPLGMTGFPAFPHGVETLGEHAILFDMVYSPVETELLGMARARGLRTVDGLEMLVAQAAAAFEHFFGRPAPREHDVELRTLLVA